MQADLCGPLRRLCTANGEFLLAVRDSARAIARSCLTGHDDFWLDPVAHGPRMDAVCRWLRDGDPGTSLVCPRRNDIACHLGCGPAALRFALCV